MNGSLDVRNMGDFASDGGTVDGDRVARNVFEIRRDTDSDPYLLDCERNRVAPPVNHPQPLEWCMALKTELDERGVDSFFIPRGTNREQRRINLQARPLWAGGRWWDRTEKAWTSHDSA